jgi:hypothetical protein
MNIDCTSTLMEWQSNPHGFNPADIQPYNIIIRVFFADRPTLKGDGFFVSITNGANGADRVFVPPAQFDEHSAGSDLVYSNVPLARHGWIRVQVVVGSRSLLGGNGNVGSSAGEARMNSMFVRDFSGPTRAPRVNGRRTLIFNLREENYIQSPSSTTHNGSSFAAGITVGAEPAGVGMEMNSSLTITDPSSTYQAAPRVYGTGRWTLDQVR